MKKHYNKKEKSISEKEGISEIHNFKSKYTHFLTNFMSKTQILCQKHILWARKEYKKNILK